MDMLPADFTPGEWDVICQRGKDSFEHVGNNRFRECIDEHIDSYLNAGSRQEKTNIVTKIYEQIRQKATKPCEGFVKRDLLTRRWFQVSEKEARDKVGQALRDAIKIIRAASRKKAGGSLSKRKREDGDSRMVRRRTADQEEKAPVGQGTSLLSQLESTYERRIGQTGNAMASLMKTDNALNSLGALPFTMGRFGRVDELESTAMRGMLGSVIDQSDSLQDQLNANRRIGNPSHEHSLSAMVALNRDRQELNQHLLTKHAQQMTPAENLNTLRRLSLIGDQKVFPSQDWPTLTLDGTTNLAAQSLYGGLQSLHNQLSLTAEQSNPLQTTSLIPQQVPWDLEPTPITDPASIP